MRFMDGIQYILFVSQYAAYVEAISLIGNISRSSNIIPVHSGTIADF